MGCIGIGSMGERASARLLGPGGCPRGGRVRPAAQVPGEGQADRGRAVRRHRLHDVPGLSRAAGPAGYRRGLHRHAGPLARPDRHRGRPQPQRHVHGETRRCPRRGGQGPACGREPLRRGLSVRHPAAVQPGIPALLRAGPQRPHRQAAHDRRRLPAGHGVREPAAAAAAGPERVRLRHVAGSRPLVAVHLPAVRLAGRGQSRLLDAHPRLRPRLPQRRLGHPPRGHRPMGQQHRRHRPAGDRGHRRHPPATACATPPSPGGSSTSTPTASR